MSDTEEKKDSSKKEYTPEEITKIYQNRISEYKNAIKDLKVEEEYWRLISSIAQSKHILFTITKQKAEYATDNSDKNKEDNTK